MILGDLEPEMTVSVPVVSIQPQPTYNIGAESIRNDADEIVTGGYGFPFFPRGIVDGSARP